MIQCPDCGFANIDGADMCEKCQKPLCGLSDPHRASHLEDSLFRDPIARLNPRRPLVVAPETPAGEVLRRMVDRAGGCAVVASEGKVVGIFTERDALMDLGPDAAAMADRPIRELMTASVETLELDDSIAFAVHKMDVGGYRHLPILSAGQIEGIISVRDILDYITANA